MPPLHNHEGLAVKEVVHHQVLDRVRNGKGHAANLLGDHGGQRGRAREQLALRLGHLAAQRPQLSDHCHGGLCH
eukprot:5255989-Pyramimonas_sp.AAC.1